MKFYSFEKLYLLSHGNPTKILDYFKDEIEGENFIVNPKALVDAFWVSEQHKAEYLGLCALRNYNDYAINKEVDLDRDLIPDWVPISVIEENPLVTLTETKIIFNKEKI